METSSPTYLSSFGRRIGRRITGERAGLMEGLLPQIAIPLPSEPIDMKSLLPNYHEIHLEIGFGGGEHLAEQAKNNPHIGYIGCEPFLNGVGSLLQHIDRHQLSNIRIFSDDVRLLLPFLPDQSLSWIYILYPDPWPKLRHHKRRLVNHYLLKELARLQKQGSKLLLATDHPDYLKWMEEHINASPHYHLSAERNHAAALPDGWVTTRYQEKTQSEGRDPNFLLCLRQ